MLNFDENEHVYRWDGEVVPSVTQAIQEWVRRPGSSYYVNTFTGVSVPAEYFEPARDFGSAVHKACKYLLTGEGLDWDSLDPVLVPPLRQFEQWTKDFKVKPLYIETPMYSHKHRVAGTPDLLCYLNGDKSFVALPDFKTGLDSPMTGPQTAAYEMISREDRKIRQVIRRFKLGLPKNGAQYRFTPLTNSHDLAFFLARRFQYSYLQNS